MLSIFLVRLLICDVLFMFSHSKIASLRRFGVETFNMLQTLGIILAGETKLAISKTRATKFNRL